MLGQNWRERAWCHDATGHLRSVPAIWTDLVTTDPFNVAAAGGRAAFQAQKLLDLADLIGPLSS